ncbi:hypothetical protein [Roseofilum capinflatum]|uniref:TSP C-terminal domain-containing protein n=1 Tax=Roseofilum capinflatum BLCC-M114 TaxID=3022440 RepID=A0ABT7B4G9_9CYAN|nr:hypothetical protein [Roseofilum capinflatum]MDJ1174074.1 hypothetical protein [Roseofilum capinflatum BLCC-M114]
MSMLHNCFKAFSVVGIFSLLNIAAPVWAANSIKLKVNLPGTPEQEAVVPIAELERFAQTGKTSDLPQALWHITVSGMVSITTEDIYEQLNRPISVNPNEPLDWEEQHILSFLSPPISEEKRKVSAQLIAEKANGKKLITFLKTAPEDTITGDNFLSTLQAYKPTKSNPRKLKPIDLTTWKQEGLPGSGTWVVSADGSSVLQTINGNPTFFVSPEEFINTTVTGKFRVEDTIDNDFIGFVFGYQSPIAAKDDPVNDFKFLLFDWTKLGSIREHGHEGFALTEVKGTFLDYASGFWHHQESAEFDLLATNYGLGKGWKARTDYDFTLLYETDRIKIDIDGETIFDISGEFEPGRFGFYNYSQRYVRYSGFASGPVPEPAAVGGLVVLGLVGLGKMASRKRKGA